MRNRSLSRARNGSTASVREKWDYVNPGFTDYVADSQIDIRSTIIKENESVISDVVGSGPQVKIDPVTGRWVRIHRQQTVRLPLGRSIRFKEDLRPSHPCTHTTTNVVLEKGLVVAEEAIRFPGNPIHERHETRTVRHEDSSTVISDNSAGGSVESYLWTSSAGAYSSDAYREHDWFALTDAFNEACDQYIPSSFLLGEDIAQNSIFVDALRLVLNPTSSIRFLLKAVANAPRKVRRMSLGQASSYLAKNSANANLFYQFGIKPAVRDLRSIFDAHRKVSSRMDFLSKNAGSYVPVRVRTSVKSGIANNALDLPDPAVQTHYQWQCDSKESTAVIGAWARVREDLNFGDTWSAYLQYFGINKMAGLVWELIPFSFVVDWFTNTQERINHYTRLRTGGPFTELSRLWASEKRSTIEKLYCIPGSFQARSRFMTLPADPFVIATRRITDYSRYTKIPDVSGVVDLSALGLFHYVTGASLLVQRWLK